MHATAPDPARFILWAPVALGLGASTYFLPSVEPPVWLATVFWVIGAGLSGLGVVLRARPAGFFAVCVMGMFLMGFALAQTRSNQVAPPDFELSDRAVTVEGWIETVERGGPRPRLRIRVARLSGAQSPPHRIRIRAGLGEFGPGDAVSFRAVLSKPPGPAAPGGYDPARAAWFDRVALTGFAVSALTPSDVVLGDRAERTLARTRWALAERIRAQMGPRSGGVAAALLTGDRSAVDPEDAEALRVSGLGHILAISGLHMALFAGGIYFAARWVIAAVEPFARAQDPRKPAALFALAAATAYLVLSGAAIPTQRAWVMSAVVLIGVMLDRRAFSMRALALAALAVIIFAPESVVEAGFQMSFAAVAALIAVYEAWGRLRPERHGRPGLWGQALAGFGGLAMTSLIAGTATGAFAAFHFQRLAAFGLAANLTAMPVFTFWVMPAGVLALGLSPFGMDGPALAVMEAGLTVVLAISHWTAELSGAAVTVIAADGVVIGLYAMGFAAAALGLGLMRLLGMASCLIALGVWALQSPADLMVTDGGVILAKFEQEGVFQASSLRVSRFASRVLLQRAGQGGAELNRASLRCDRLGCTGVTRNGVHVAVTDQPDALAEDCRRVDLLVFRGQASGWRRRRCAAVLLDETALNEFGGLEFKLVEGQLTLTGAAQARRRHRLWNQSSS